MLDVEPRRAARWHFGDRRGIQVWGVGGDCRVWASVLIGHGDPIVLLNDRIACTDREHGVLDWAFGLVSRGLPGLFVLIAERA